MALGVRFKPSEEQSMMGRQQGAKEGVQQAIQMLSLRYPKVLGASSPVGDSGLLAGRGAPRVSGFNPDAAILQAMIRALSSGGSSVVSQPLGSPRTNTPRANTPGSRVSGPPRSVAQPSRAQTAPSFTPGITSWDPAVQAAQQENMDRYNDGTYGGAAPGWTPPPSAPLRQVTGDPAAAAQRSSGGYRSALGDKYDWMGSRTGNPFL